MEFFATFYEVKGCNVTYHQLFLGMKFSKYDFDKVFWKSASSENVQNKTFFILDGQIGVQSLRAFDLKTNEDLTNGLFIFGLAGGEFSRIRFNYY